MAPSPSLLTAHTPALGSGRRRNRHTMVRATLIAALAVGSTMAFCIGAWTGLAWLVTQLVA